MFANFCIQYIYTIYGATEHMFANYCIQYIYTIYGATEHMFAKLLEDP